MSNEAERILSLLRHRLLGTGPEKEYDDIVEVAAHVCNTPMGGVTLIDSERQWFKARKGLNIEETARRIAFCNHAISGNGLFTVEDAKLDSRFIDNPLVLSYPNIRFYAGAPIKSVDAHVLGTLWVADTVPRQLTTKQQELLQRLGTQVEALLRLKFYLAELHTAIQDREDVLNRLQKLQRTIALGERRSREIS